MFHTHDIPELNFFPEIFIWSVSSVTNFSYIYCGIGSNSWHQTWTIPVTVNFMVNLTSVLDIFHCLTLLKTQFFGESNLHHLQVGCRDWHNTLLHLLETHSLCSALGQASLFSRPYSCWFYIWNCAPGLWQHWKLQSLLPWYVVVINGT